MRETDHVLQLASFSFDVSMLEIMTSLITGACVCIPGDASRSQGPAHCIQEFGVTWAFLTPSLVKLMTPEMVPTLRFLVLGGEADMAAQVVGSCATFAMVGRPSAPGQVPVEQLQPILALVDANL